CVTTRAPLPDPPPVWSRRPQGCFGAMKNFARALRHAWPYRGRLIVSIVCALFAAVLWGLNFTSIYPVLKLLHTGDSLHQWIDKSIAKTQEEIKATEKKVDELSDEEQKLEKLPPGRQVDKDKRKLAGELLRQESKLNAARASLAWGQKQRQCIVAFMPDDCFLTLVYVVVMVLIGVFIKCFFEFVQESLVGSVVNRTQFDLRNRFYRNAIHLDVAQFSEQGTTELMARFTNDMES